MVSDFVILPVHRLTVLPQFPDPNLSWLLLVPPCLQEVQDL